MTYKQRGKQSIVFRNPPFVKAAASVVSSKEGLGPYGDYFDIVEEDAMLGAQTWEEAEGLFQERAAELVIKKAELTKKDIRYVVAGDLLGQLMASSFGLLDLSIPLFGIYGACSTMGESLGIASMIIDGEYADNVLAITSSHFASAEKQFRFPLGYGNQRPRAATWTVTGSGAIVVSRECQKNEKCAVRIKGITTGKIIDFGIKDSMNMGACMAPAASGVICQNFLDLEVGPSYYDKIITGDLGMVGKDILLDFVRAKGFEISDKYMDCGIEIYGEDKDAQAGGSGCGCSAVMLAGYILEMLKKRVWKRVLFVPTGALLSPVSFNEGNSVPGIAHGVILERFEI